MKLNNFKFSPRFVLIFIIIFIILLTAGSVLFNLHSKINGQKASKTTTSLEKYCRDKAAEFDCQKSYYLMLYERGGMASSYGALKNDYATNASIKSNCHQLTHAVGRAAGNKHGDVSKAYAEGDELCSSGYYHGVMEAILDSSQNTDVRTKLDEVCDGVSKDKKYKLPHHNCAHGLGHGLMLIEGSELFLSLEGCDRLTDSWERQSCYGGVFMENIMASTNPDHSTKYIKADDPLYPCTTVEDKYLSSCYLMQSSQALKVINYDYSKMFELCNGIQDWVRQTCYESVGRDASGLNAQNPDAAKELCMKSTTPMGREGCVVGAVKDIVWFYHAEEPGTKFCSSLVSELQDACKRAKQDYVASF